MPYRWLFRFEDLAFPFLLNKSFTRVPAILPLAANTPLLLLCRSRDLIRNSTGAEREDCTWNAKLFCELHVDSIRSLLVSLNAIKRTQLLTEYNSFFSAAGGKMVANTVIMFLLFPS